MNKSSLHFNAYKFFIEHDESIFFEHYDYIYVGCLCCKKKIRHKNKKTHLQSNLHFDKYIKHYIKNIMEEEIFKQIEGFDNYKISNLGNIEYNSGYIDKPKIFNKNGYQTIILLNNNNEWKIIDLHQLLTQLFMPVN